MIEDWFDTEQVVIVQGQRAKKYKDGPDGVDDVRTRVELLNRYGIEIGRGLGEFAGKVWRIGLMGESSKAEHVYAILAALEDILPSLGYEVPRGAGVAAASQALADS